MSVPDDVIAIIENLGVPFSVPVTSNVARAGIAGNVFLTRRTLGEAARVS